MRRIAKTLAGLSFLWACAATIYLIVAAGHQGMGTASTFAAGAVDVQRVTVSLASRNGPWLVGLLLGVALLSGMPFGVAVAHPPGQRAATWSTAVLLLAFAVIAGFSIGLFYLPSAVLMGVSAVLVPTGPSGAEISHRRPLLGLLVVASAASYGCASTKKAPTPRTVAEPCAGQAVLIVENSSGYELDVVEAAARSGSRTVIATVGNGYHEVLVRREGGYYYFTRRARGGATEASESMRASAGDRVRLHRECRTY